jgi:hypothetical protein
MHYKLYRYTLTKLTEDSEREVHPDKHYKIFSRSKGKDGYGQLSEYRGKKDSVLMYLREYRSDFTGLIGRHSTEREITAYLEKDDETTTQRVGDDDYPHAAFVCIPRLRMIACIDNSQVKADGAMGRLHQILIQRQKVIFVVQAITETFDLRKAVQRFRLIDVTFDVLPVNPHSEDLGLALDESRALDHIRKISGKATATPAHPLTLNGGFLTSVQQLQKSGHAKVGFVGLTEDNIEVKVQKPGQTTELSEDGEEAVWGENVGVKINIPGKHDYPFPQSHVTLIRKIARKFMKAGVDEDDE